MLSTPNGKVLADCIRAVCPLGPVSTKHAAQCTGDLEQDTGPGYSALGPSDLSALIRIISAVLCPNDLHLGASPILGPACDRKVPLTLVWWDHCCLDHLYVVFPGVAPAGLCLRTPSHEPL